MWYVCVGGRGEEGVCGGRGRKGGRVREGCGQCMYTVRSIDDPQNVDKLIGNE